MCHFAAQGQTRPGLALWRGHRRSEVAFPRWVDWTGSLFNGRDRLQQPVATGLVTCRYSIPRTGNWVQFGSLECEHRIRKALSSLNIFAFDQAYFIFVALHIWFPNHERFQQKNTGTVEFLNIGTKMPANVGKFPPSKLKHKLSLWNKYDMRCTTLSRHLKPHSSAMKSGKSKSRKRGLREYNGENRTKGGRYGP